MGMGAFAGCSSLAEFYAPKLASIGDNAFSAASEDEDGTTVYAGCPLTGFDLTGVVSIGAGAFAGCTEIKELVVPAGVESIGTGAFAGWTEEQSIRIEITEDECGWADGWDKDTKADINWKPAEEQAEA